MLAIQRAAPGGFVERPDGGTDHRLARRHRDKPDGTRRAGMCRQIVDVMLDLVHAFIIAESAAVPGGMRLGMEIADQDHPARRGDARQLGISAVDRRQMPQHQPAPDHVEIAIRKGQMADVSDQRPDARHDRAASDPGIEHFGTKVDPDRLGRAAIDQATADRLNRAKASGGRIIAVGTTSLRLLESAARDDGTIEPFEGDTAIFITPGYRFKAVDGLITNFHLPRSTLFMLVSALMGLDVMKSAYAHAIAEGYRFYSYGDASLLLPAQR